MTSTNKQLRARIRRLEMALRQLHDVTAPIEHLGPIRPGAAAVIVGARIAAQKVLDEKDAG
jgi:hypothetical protein